MEKDKIKRFIEIHIPVTACNLRCHYCYITQLNLWKNKQAQFNYSVDTIRKALSVKRLGGKCMMNLCGGGETLIPEETLQIAKAFLEEGHYVTIVTNGTISKRFDELASFPKELLERLFFKFSFQFLELKRTKMMQKFFENISKVKALGCSFALEVTPNDELIPYIDEIKEISMKYLKALPHITIARVDAEPGVPMLTKLSKEEFANVWKQFDSKMLEFKLPVFGEKRNEFCYAGDWSFCINVGTGMASKCYKGASMGNLFENIDKPINFSAIGKKCPLPHCYNAHSFLLWGDIPNFSKTTYADIRNRKCSDGSEWLNDTMKYFMNSKLQESNKEYSLKRKSEINKTCNSCKKKEKFFEQIFSVKNEVNNKNEKTHKVFRILGVKFKLKRRKHKDNSFKCTNNNIESRLNSIKNIETKLDNLMTFVELERFDRQLSQMVPKDQMIFVCINGIGDAMLYVSYWRELEEMYKSKIFWVVTKSHEIVLKLYGVTNYMVLDSISAHKKGHFSEGVNITTKPVKGIPFYAHWTYNKATCVKEDYFLDFVRNSMGLHNVPLNHPVWYPEIDENLNLKISCIKDLSKTILISPDARWLPLNDVNLWNSLIKELKLAGYEVIVNDFLNAMKLDADLCRSDFTTEELVALSQKCYATISPRSGFTDIVHELGDRLFVIYSDKKWVDLFTLNKLCSSGNVNEYIYSKDISVNQIVNDIKKISQKKEAKL